MKFTSSVTSTYESSTDASNRYDWLSGYSEVILWVYSTSEYSVYQGETVLKVKRKRNSVHTKLAARMMINMVAVLSFITVKLEDEISKTISLFQYGNHDSA